MKKVLPYLALAVVLFSPLLTIPLVAFAGVGERAVAKLEGGGTLTLTFEPCAIPNPPEFEYRAFAVLVNDDEGQKEGCWHGDDLNVYMMFPDQPGRHLWPSYYFKPVKTEVQ